MRRFQMETERLIDYMATHERDQDCLVFLDGSLVATFAEAFELESRQFYVACLLELLRAQPAVSGAAGCLHRHLLCPRPEGDAAKAVSPAQRAVSA